MVKNAAEAAKPTESKAKQYIYIVQASLEQSRCKIGKTNDLERRLKEYNSMTGKSKNNVYTYLFTCEVKDMARVENAVKEEFSIFREESNTEIYLYNSKTFTKYVKFIKSHELFIKEMHYINPITKPAVKIVPKTTPSLKERGLTRKDVMQRAKRADDDEFYTRYEDIEKELSMYDKRIWKNKVVFCNCDDAVGKNENETSAFAWYFLENFKTLGLKTLICTHYSGPVDLFNQGVKGYIFRKTGFKVVRDEPDGYTGSFDDPISLKILNEEADIVCTNPPFSKMIDYWKILIESGKKFIIISAESNAVNTAYIPYFMNNKVWTGYNSVYWYENPKRQLVRAAGRWYTNIKIKDRETYKRLKIIPLKEIPDKYKRYDDSKILLVDGGYIPSDYKKPFAVSSNPILNGLLEKGYKIVKEKKYVPYIAGDEKFARVLVQKS